MSAFFVQEGVVDDVLRLWMMSLPKVPSEEELMRKGSELLRMNAEAMAQRYPQIRDDGEHAEYLEVAAKYAPWPSSEREEQLIQSAQCLRYQCTEGDVPETWPLWKWLTALIEAQPERFRGGPTYDRARWDRPRAL
jgi:hypothetical protein